MKTEIPQSHLNPSTNLPFCSASISNLSDYDYRGQKRFVIIVPVSSFSVLSEEERFRVVMISSFVLWWSQRVRSLSVPSSVDGRRGGCPQRHGLTCRRVWQLRRTVTVPSPLPKTKRRRKVQNVHTESLVVHLVLGRPFLYPFCSGVQDKTWTLGLPPYIPQPLSQHTTSVYRPGSPNT